MIPYRSRVVAGSPAASDHSVLTRSAARDVDVLLDGRGVNVLLVDGDQRGADVLGHLLAAQRVDGLLDAVLAFLVGTLGDGELDGVRLERRDLLRLGIEGSHLNLA